MRDGLWGGTPLPPPPSRSGRSVCPSVFCPETAAGLYLSTMSPSTHRRWSGLTWCCPQTPTWFRPPHHYCNNHTRETSQEIQENNHHFAFISFCPPHNKIQVSEIKCPLCETTMTRVYELIPVTMSHWTVGVAPNIWGQLLKRHRSSSLLAVISHLQGGGPWMSRSTTSVFTAET